MTQPHCLPAPSPRGTPFGRFPALTQPAPHPCRQGRKAPERIQPACILTFAALASLEHTP